MLLPVELLVFVGVWLSSRYLLQWWNGLGKESRRYPPSLPSLPLVGSLPFMFGFSNIADFFMKKAEELGPIFTFRAGSKLVLVLNSREVIEDALVNHSSAFAGRSPVYIDSITNPSGKGLAFKSTTKEWKKYHKLSLSILRQLGFGVKSTMEARILSELESITEFIQKQNGRAFNPKEMVYLSATNVITSILFGSRHDYNLGMSEFGRQLTLFIESFDADLDVAPILRFLPFHRNKLLQHIAANGTLRTMMHEDIEKILKDDDSDCFVSRYLKHEGPDYDAEQLHCTLRDLLGAATDTSANALTFALIALANNPDVQNRVRAEIDAVIPRNRPPSMMDQPNLPYVEATSLEVMRWRTLLPLALPHMTMSDTSVVDYFVPSGTTVLVNLHAAHTDPKVWKDPQTFRPERFLDKDGRVVNEESVIAFSLGRRACLGESLARAEFFLCLTGLVQRFIIQPPEGQKNVDSNPLEPLTLVLASNEFEIRLIARD